MKDDTFCWMAYGTLCIETDHKLTLEDKIKTCINCEVLKLNIFEILKETTNKEEILKPFYILFKQIDEYKTQLIMCHNISKLMQSTIDLEKVLHIILNCVTAGYGLGFNRALLLLVNKKNKERLNGIIAVGPKNKEEAYRIWNELSGINLSSMELDNIIEIYNGVFSKKDEHLDSIAKRISINISEENVFSEIIRKATSFVVRNAKNNNNVPKEFLDIWGADVFALAPLVSKSEVLGVIVADNIYNEKPITDGHLELLNGFANQARLAIDNAMLYENVEDKLQEVEKLNLKLKEINDMLLRSEKLSAIGEMTSTTAHEIRTPLMSIGGFARLIKEEVNKKVLNDYSNKEVNGNINKDVLNEYTDIIINEVTRLENIIGSILDFTRPVRLMFKQTDINAIIKETLLLLEQNIVKFGVEKEIVLDNNLPSILVDDERMKQILINIFNNAIESMSDRESKKLSVFTYSKNNFVKIEIKDTGEGIPKSELDNICKPFFTTKEKGVGLGLYIANKIIREHMGSLDVKSVVGEGTSFIINLPIERRISR
jgi:signal transduction histidine kinase